MSPTIVKLLGMLCTTIRIDYMSTFNKAAINLSHHYLSHLLFVPPLCKVSITLIIT